ncbi:MAG TPA: ATP-dependent Clp protease adaptor ClpS [Melioribacteraceae bacterium]|nr:ATP-dependent Clp protease adaptor ClpS [Melioribacteraceae bacterium]
MIFNQDIRENISSDVSEEVTSKLSYRVVLFNDDWHTFDEVITQLIKALGCSYDKASALTLKVHLNGKAVVYEGELAKCLKISSVLEEISLHTQIES